MISPCLSLALQPAPWLRRVYDGLGSAVGYHEGEDELRRDAAYTSHEIYEQSLFISEACHSMLHFEKPVRRIAAEISHRRHVHKRETVMNLTPRCVHATVY